MRLPFCNYESKQPCVLHMLVTFSRQPGVSALHSSHAPSRCRTRSIFMRYDQRMNSMGSAVPSLFTSRWLRHVAGRCTAGAGMRDTRPCACVADARGSVLQSDGGAPDPVGLPRAAARWRRRRPGQGRLLRVAHARVHHGPGRRRPRRTDGGRMGPPSGRRPGCGRRRRPAPGSPAWQLHQRGE